MTFIDTLDPLSFAIGAGVIMLLWIGSRLVSKKKKPKIPEMLKLVEDIHFNLIESNKGLQRIHKTFKEINEGK